MKKIIAILCLAFSLNGLNAQFEHHDIQLSYGLVTSDQILDALESVLISIFSFGIYEKDNFDYSGAKFLTYRNSLTYRLSLGATLGIDNVTGDLSSLNTKYGDFKKTHTTLALEGDLKWVRRDLIQMYSGLGLGYTFSKETGEIFDTGEKESIPSGHVAIQFNALGLRIGKSFGGYFELGFGYKGIINFGLSYQLE